MIARILLAATLLGIAAPAFAGDREFNAVVKGIEKHYHIRHQRLLTYGLIKFFLRPPQTRDLHFAVYENLRQPIDPSDGAMENIVTCAIGPNWKRIVRVFSRRQQEWTEVYVDSSARQLRMFVIALQPREATVVKLRVPPGEMEDWINDPASLARKHR